MEQLEGNCQYERFPLTRIPDHTDRCFPGIIVSGFSANTA